MIEYGSAMVAAERPPGFWGFARTTRARARHGVYG